MRLLTQLLLLAAIITLVLARALPIAIEDVERRWSQGESEVCCIPSNAPGCYVLAWFRSLGGRRVRLPVCSCFPLPSSQSRTH
jgi:hypothetical protein